jgi:hypothetical protein
MWKIVVHSVVLVQRVGQDALTGTKGVLRTLDVERDCGGDVRPKSACSPGDDEPDAVASGTAGEEAVDVGAEADMDAGAGSPSLDPVSVSLRGGELEWTAAWSAADVCCRCVAAAGGGEVEHRAAGGDASFGAPADDPDTVPDDPTVPEVPDVPDVPGVPGTPLPTPDPADPAETTRGEEPTGSERREARSMVRARSLTCSSRRARACSMA